MSKYYPFRSLCGIVLSFSVTFPAMAQFAVTTCDSIVLTGLQNWEPYTIITDQGIEGIGIEIAQKIFSELDIPTKTVQLDNNRRRKYSLRNGDIDVVVSMYENPDLAEIVDIIEPGYLEDPVVIAVSTLTHPNYRRFEDLVGSRGVVADHFDFHKEFQDFQSRYLYILQKGNLKDILELVNQRKSDYVIGSLNQLTYGLSKFGLKDTLKLVPNMEAKASVHMGFSKASKCHPYIAYLKRRLTVLSQNGTLQSVVGHYIQGDTEHPVDQIKRPDPAHEPN